MSHFAPPYRPPGKADVSMRMTIPGLFLLHTLWHAGARNQARRATNG
ncbi:MAG: hypothetical protein ABWZ83_01790 [Mesorhizobium sp.]